MPLGWKFSLWSTQMRAAGIKSIWLSVQVALGIAFLTRLLDRLWYIYNIRYYMYYIYIWYPPQNLCRLQFYWYLQWIFYILAPILFRLNLRHQQWENWKTEFHRRSLGSILLLWNSVFQFFSSRLLLKGENPKSWKNWKNQVTPSCVNNLEYEHLTRRSIEATDYTRIGRLRQGKNKQIIDLYGH